MPVTELALLHLTSGTSITDPSIRSKLAHAKSTMEKYTSRTFYILQQIEDPSYLYILGEWDSLDQHVNHFIPSAENRSLLESLRDQVSVDWLLHLDVSHDALPLPPSEEDKMKARSGERVWSIVRYFIKDGQKEHFMKTFEAKQHLLLKHMTEGKVGGGWRVDGEAGKEERVSFCPWTGVEQHMAFAKTEDFEKYKVIRDFVDGSEIKHVRILEFE